MCGSVEAITASAIAGETLLGRGIWVSSAWADVSAVSVVKIVAALASGTLACVNTVAGDASAVARLACGSYFYVTTRCRASPKAISTSTVSEQIVHTRTRKARKAGRSVTSSTAGIASGTAIIPRILILIGAARGKASRVGAEEESTINA